MASNEIPESPDPLISLAMDAEDGANINGPGIGLAQNTAAAIHTDLAAVIGDPAATPPVVGTRNAYQAAKAAKVFGSAARRTAESNSRAFCASAVGLLKNYLGTHWNSQWQAAGFTTGSLAIPVDTMPMLTELSAYFGTHSSQENTELDITAAACTARQNTLSDARSIANQRVLELGDAKAAGDAALKQLYHRMTGLRAELSQLLEDDDPRWYAFGFDRPADGQGPGPVRHFVLTPGGPGMVFADWDDARRAERYRVFKQVIGTDAEPVEVDNSVHDSDYTFTGLPSGAEVSITIVAVNSAGDGALSASDAIIVP